MLDRRAKLLDEVADYILNNGLADLSLRPLATAIDTSPRMLLYFFGSKERLIAEALAHIRAREQIDFKRAVSKPRPADRLESLLRDWRSSASPRTEKYSRLFFELRSRTSEPRAVPGISGARRGRLAAAVRAGICRRWCLPCAGENPRYSRVGCSARSSSGPARHR